MKMNLIIIFCFLAITGVSSALPLQLSARTDKQAYDLGEIITVHYKIVNKGDDPIIMFGGDCFYYGFYDVSTDKPLQLIDFLPSDSGTTGYPLILLLSNEGFENVLEMKFEKTNDNKLFVSVGMDSYWVANQSVTLKGFYSKSSELNEQVFKMWKLPLYDGEDVESKIRFRIQDDKVIVEEVPKSKEQQQKEDEQRKVHFYSSDNSEGTIKATYGL